MALPGLNPPIAPGVPHPLLVYGWNTLAPADNDYISIFPALDRGDKTTLAALLGTLAPIGGTASTAIREVQNGDSAGELSFNAGLSTGQWLYDNTAIDAFKKTFNPVLHRYEWWYAAASATVPIPWTLWMWLDSAGLHLAAGLVGPAGPAGPAGQGVPTGGTTGQVLTKIDATNYNTYWATPAAGGGGGTGTYYSKPDNPGAFTMTLASAGVGSYIASAAIHDVVSGIGHLDVLVSFAVKVAGTGISASGNIGVYAFASIDGGPTFTDAIPAGGGNVTSIIPNPPNIRFLGNLTANASGGAGLGITYIGGPFSVAGGFNGVMPEWYGVVLFNNTGQAFDAVEASHKKMFQGYWQVQQ